MDKLLIFKKLISRLLSFSRACIMDRYTLYWCVGIAIFLGLTIGSIILPIWINQSFIRSMDTDECRYIDTIEDEYKVPYMIVNVSVPLYLDTLYSIHINKYNINLCQECNEWYLNFRDFIEITECQSHGVSYYIVVNDEVFTTDDIKHHSFSGSDFTSMIMFALVSFSVTFCYYIFVEELN